MVAERCLGVTAEAWDVGGRVGAVDTHACAAIEHLSDARRTRAEELHEQLANSYVHCRRLTVIVEGDLRADGATKTSASPR